ncbi:MAG: hypothetical protein WB804_07715, partial [Candidatus Dormiibacterota bacterium]
YRLARACNLVAELGSTDPFAVCPIAACRSHKRVQPATCPLHLRNNHRPKSASPHADGDAPKRVGVTLGSVITVVASLHALDLKSSLSQLDPI